MDTESRIQMKADWDYLHPLAVKAMEYMGTDPAASLNKARIAGEALSKRVYELTGGVKKGKKPLAKLEFEELMHHLRKEVPQTIVVHLETVQHLGNYGSHDHRLDGHPATPSDALTCPTALSTAISWYFQQFFGETIQIIDSTPQAAQQTSEEVQRVPPRKEPAMSTSPRPEGLDDGGHDLRPEPHPPTEVVRWGLVRYEPETRGECTRAAAAAGTWQLSHCLDHVAQIAHGNGPARTGLSQWLHQG